MFDVIRKSRPILGMNARNLRYIRPSNFSRARHLADNKISSKRVLKKNGIPVPALIAKISSTQMLEQFDWNILPQSFALKPNRGFGGEGIIVVYGKKKSRDDAWIKADGALVTVDDLKNHIYNILEGTYSLANTPDVAFFEERMKLSKVFKPYVFKGIPDIRVIVYNKVPVMAMLRLPTKASGGKANLQQGAIGVGIDLASGTTTTAVQGKSKIIEYFPGTRLLLSGIKIPYWRDILTLAVKAQEVSGVGFLGADIAIDRDRGPVFLELNARPGLSIQIANLAGLKGRLERVQGLVIKTIERGVTVGMNLFGGEIESEVEEISGKKIIGTVEKVSLLGKDDTRVDVNAKINTGA
ncbi:MAG TPA: sugar-transfer associated ATP-grasp domain-containing protein, partial [Patescibacteria group bacterium]|nr:sugar-transfer associated ATP-grasp domain-containing protein [Patescibacteria group bacterium]